MADRAGIGRLVGYAAEASPADESVSRALAAAAWHLGAKFDVVCQADTLLAILQSNDPGILLIPEPCALIREALAAGWIVLTSRRHRDARHGRELFWVAAQRPEVLVRALLHVAGLSEGLPPIRQAAREFGRSISADRFMERWGPPLISVIMPVFNAESTVVGAIRSALEQTIADLELIVVDDGSTDGSRERTLEVTDPRVVRIWQPGGGPSAARNAGLAQASSESFLSFLDSDDQWKPTFLERLITTLETAPASAGLAFCDYTLSLDGGAETVCQIEDASFPRLVTSDGLIPTGAFVFRRIVLASAGFFDEELFRGEDYAWLLRVAAMHELVRVPEVLFHYRRRSDGQLLSTTPDQHRLQRARLDALNVWTSRAGQRAGAV